MDMWIKSKQKKARKGNRKERGQSLVEMAMSFMIIAFLLSGAVDLGRAYFVYVALRDAAQEGAVYGSLAPSDISGIESRIQESSTGPINFSSDPNLTWPPSITYQGSTACSGFYEDIFTGETKANAIVVSIEYHFPLTMALIQAMVPGNSITLTASSTYSILFPPCP
jgi:Flp pilus assembly protein TadG